MGPEWGAGQHTEAWILSAAARRARTNLAPSRIRQGAHAHAPILHSTLIGGCMQYEYRYGIYGVETEYRTVRLRTCCYNYCRLVVGGVGTK